MTINLETPTQGTMWPAQREFWRGRVVRGSATLLLSSGVVAVTNLLYNLLIARMLGAAGFGHASALYTLLMLVTALTLSFQIVTSKLIARNSEPGVQAQIYSTFHRSAWQVGAGVAVLMCITSAFLKSYLKLPAQHDLILLAIAAGVYVPLGVRRGRMQGCCQFDSLAFNLLVEVAVKFVGALLFLYLRTGVTGVMAAVLLSIVASYAAGQPGPQSAVTKRPSNFALFAEALQAVLYFIGQVILSNLDILLVKHFFPPFEAGIYATVALVGRVVFMLSWSVVSSMFPISAGHARAQNGRSVLYTGLLLVGGLITIFVAAVAAVPTGVWAMLLGKQFLLGSAAGFPALLTEYALMSGIYCTAVVIMMYEISRRIGAAAWIQLCASMLLAAGIWRYHDSLLEVIHVQMIVMGALLIASAVPLMLDAEAADSESPLEPLRLLRPVSEDEVIAEFLRGEFYHPDYEPYRRDFQHVVDRSSLDRPDENSIRRALLFRRRGRLWRELPSDTQWWEVELTARDLPRLQSFPRNEWRRFAGGGFYLTEMVRRIESDLSRGEVNRTLQKLEAIASDLQSNQIPNAVLLIGVDERQPMTIIEGNHRMIAALLAMPDSAHGRFRFYCGLSPHMNSCCWHYTNLRSILRYVRHLIGYMFHDADFFLLRTLRGKLAQSELPTIGD
jgi:O-antigen/teichoic acid export membrane protein